VSKMNQFGLGLWGFSHPERTIVPIIWGVIAWWPGASYVG